MERFAMAQPHCRGITRRDVLGALAAAPVLSGMRPAGAENAFRNLEKALWVWKERSLQPEDLDAFASTHNIGTLFLYIGPPAAEALLGSNPSAREVLVALRSHARRIYAMAGEPDWALGPSALPGHLDLLIRLQRLQPRMFDGIHLDVEPNGMKEWNEPAGKARLIEGTLRFYDLTRRHASGIAIDAAVNPLFASLRTAERDNFLVALTQRVHSISIMAYRNEVQATLAWAEPAVMDILNRNTQWRMGVQVDRNDPEPNTSWDRHSRPQFEAAMVDLDDRIRRRFSQSRYAGLVFQSFDGLRTLLAQS
jgi:hypothetical protein